MNSLHSSVLKKARPGEIISPDEVRQELGRILASTEFKASPRRREMLSYLVEEMLAGRAHALKGYAIGVSVFRRGQDFDAQADPVVRLEARRLRRDLASYYVSAGLANPLRISIPTGHYAPEIMRAERGGAPLDDQMSATAGGIDGDPGSVAPPAADGAGDRGRYRSRQGLAVLLAVLMVLAGIGYTAFDRLTAEDNPGGARGPALLVMPFQMHGGDDVPFLAAGISERLIAALKRFPDIRLYVPVGNSADGAILDPVAAGKRQAASFVLSGSVNTEEAGIRVGAQLVDAASGQVMWAEQFDRNFQPSSLLELENEIATAIATALGQPYGVIQTELTDRLSHKFTPSMPSYECLLRAYAYRRTFATELHAPVLACLEAAVKRDPEFADAWAMLGWLHMDAARYNYVPPEEVDRAYVRALAAASRAVALDGKSVLALKALASINHYTGNYEESEQIQREALALNPNDPDTLAQLGWRLAVRGNFEEGIPYLHKAIERSVHPPGWYYHLIAIDHYMNGRFEQMLETASKSVVDNSSISWSLVAIAQGALGNDAEAHQALMRMAEVSPLLNRDPAAVYRKHQATEEIVEALVTGLRKAGWTEPEASQRQAVTEPFRP